MGLGTFLGLDIGKKGVIAHQQALNVVSHNITNADSKGYSRQVVDLKASDPINQQGKIGQIGSGVDIGEVRRIRDEFIDKQVRDQTSFSGYVDSLSENLTQLQTIMNEPSESNIRGSVDEFFQSLEDLNNQPDNNSVRITLVERAKSLATLMNETASRLQEERINVNDDIGLTIERVNSMAHSLGDLNLEISKVKNSGQNPNDLMDRRDLMLDDLSELVNVDVREDANGSLYVNIGSHLLVQGSKVRELKYLINPALNGLRTLSSAPSLKEASNNPEVIKAFVGGDAVNQNVTVTVFQTATNHGLQSQPLINIKNEFSNTSTLEVAGVTSGSFYINGVQIFVDNTDTLTQVKDKINESGLGVNAVFQRGRLALTAQRTGTANKVVLSEGSSNFLDVMGFSEEKELDSEGNVLFDGKVQDAIYAVSDQTFKSASNHVHDIVPGVDVTFKEVGSANILVDHFVTGGKLKSLLEYQDRYVDDESINLDKMAYALIREVNKIHYEGFGLDGKSQRLFFQDFASPDPQIFEKGAAAAIAVERQVQNDVRTVAAANGVFEKEGDLLPVSSGNGDGTNALKLAQLKYAKIVDNSEFGLSTRLSTLNGGTGIDLGRPDSFFVISNGEKNAVVSLKHFDEDSTLIDLQDKMNEALDRSGLDSRVTITPEASGVIRLTSNNENLTFIEGAGSTGFDLRLTASSGATGNGSRSIVSAPVNAKFRGDPKSVTAHMASVVAKVGIRAEETAKLQDNANIVLTQLENERLSVMGVSVDEELTNMIRYQQGFSASARVINMVSQILDTVVNIGR